MYDMITYMNNSNLLNVKELVSIFKLFPQVKLAYFFGSMAKGKGGPLSDYDFAVFLEEKDFKKRFEIRLDLLNKLSRQLQTDNIDFLF